MADEAELLERWQGWQAAIERRDVAAARSYLDEDYALEIVQPERAVFDRDAWLGMLPDYVVSAYAAADPVVDIDGDLAAILHRAEMTATVRGADRSGIFVLTDIWRRRNGTWRVWRRHSTPLSAGAMPDAASA